jgi:8-oxo-dGTP pyrophosphatase MutT (NUDIX family)
MEMTDFCADAPRSLRSRLAQSQPQHDPLHWRLAGQRVMDADPRIRALLPVEPRPAAVLVPLVQGEQGTGILLTVRSAGLRHHANQISFPGGRIESGDADPAAAALREAQEEIGLQALQTQVLGYLPDHGVQVGPIQGLPDTVFFFAQRGIARALARMFLK